ncbi:hypothetical protein BH11PSE13_BH11PSE13_41920 [soil metagenome]
MRRTARTARAVLPAAAVALFLSAIAVMAGAQDRVCTPDRNGRMVCPQPNASCIQDRLGDIVCSTPGGGISLDRYGAAVCGPGACTQDQNGALFCSSAPQGAASTNREGKAVCAVGCVQASASMCVRPTPAN